MVYNPKIVLLESLLEIYYEVINPTSLNRQGGDCGTQYRTGIYYVDYNDWPVVERSIAKLQKRFVKPIDMEVKRLENFSLAEEYHQKYLDQNPSGYFRIG